MAPGFPVLQRRSHRGPAPAFVEPAAALPSLAQSRGIAASPSNSLLNLPVEIRRTATLAPGAASPGSRVAAILDPSGPETEIVVITRHGITIGSKTQRRKRQNAGLASWRRKGISGVAMEGAVPEAMALGALNTKRKLLEGTLVCREELAQRSQKTTCRQAFRSAATAAGPPALSCRP